MIICKKEGRLDLLVQHNHGSSVDTGRGRSQSDGLQEVKRPVRGKGGRRSHGTDNDDGF